MRAIKFIYRRVILFMSCFLVLSLSACMSDDVSDLNKYIKTIKAKPKSGIDPLPERKAIEPYVFKTDNVRDPFKPLEQPAETEDKVAAVTNMGNGIKPDMNRRKEELEAFQLDSLRMVGTVTINSTLWGLIKVNNTIYRVKTGNYMGKNYGKIIRIETDKIEVMEMLSDKPGVWHEQQASLALTDDGRAKK